MSLADLYRDLAPDEKILDGDQFKMAALPPECWAPVDKFVGHRVREFNHPLFERVVFRRLIAREVLS